VPQVLKFREDVVGLYAVLSETLGTEYSKVIGSARAAVVASSTATQHSTNRGEWRTVKFLSLSGSTVMFAGSGYGLQTPEGTRTAQAQGLNGPINRARR
jgi:hypothetical protein